MPDALKTGIVGLGQMGRGIAKNLDAKGYLCAANDTAEGAFKSADFSGRVVDCNIDDMVGTSDIILFAVPSTQQIASILGSLHGRPGQVIVDLTTSDPKESSGLASELKDRGFAYVDAAMTGGAAGADAGTLTLMVGGDEEHIHICKPALETIASKVFHLGPVGAGHAMKLVHNLILHSSFLATCEGMRLAERAGIAPDRAVEVLNAGNARSFVTEVRFPRDILSGTMMARSQISNLEKDLGLAQEFAAGLDARIPYGTMTRTFLSEALSAGHSDTDFSWLYPLYDEIVDRLDNDK